MTLFNEWTDADLVEEIDENGVGLSWWEINFIADLLIRKEQRELTLSPDQRKKLVQIAEERLTDG